MKILNIMKPKAIIVSGYFNPLHKGHIEYFNNAKAIGDILIVIVNSDYQRRLKGSISFQKEDERFFIVSNIRSVDIVFLSVDKDKSVCNSIKKLNKIYGEEYELYFANGGDQSIQESPETAVCFELGIKCIDGLGVKIQSSSWLLESIK